MHEILIALGGNLGDVEAAFESALQLLSSDIFDVRRSRIYRSVAVYDKPGTVIPDEPGPDYLDAVVRAKTFHTPQTLLECLLETEKKLGRVRPAPECSPRPIDLDLLLYDDVVIHSVNTGDLELPHPRMHTRLFVLNPACDVAPEWKHPVLNQTLEVLRDCLLE